jgi:hypothetical protein
MQTEVLEHAMLLGHLVALEVPLQLRVEVSIVYLFQACRHARTQARTREYPLTPLMAATDVSDTSEPESRAPPCENPRPTGHYDGGTTACLSPLLRAAGACAPCSPRTPAPGRRAAHVHSARARVCTSTTPRHAAPYGATTAANDTRAKRESQRVSERAQRHSHRTHAGPGANLF